MSAERGNFRLSDAERQEAIDALSEHVRTGRLDLDEYGERSARVTAAKAAAELTPLFTDLPAPHPSALHGPGAPQRPQPTRPARWPRPAAIVPIAALAGLVLLVVVPRVPPLLVLLAVVALVGVVLARRRGA